MKGGGRTSELWQKKTKASAFFTDGGKAIVYDRKNLISKKKRKGKADEGASCSGGEEEGNRFGGERDSRTAPLMKEKKKGNRRT